MKEQDILRRYRQEGQRCFSGENLKDTNFAGENLSGVEFLGGKLNRANFQGANLARVKFVNVDLQQANFQEAKLSGSEFQKTTITNVNFNKACLANANLNNAPIRSSDFSEANLCWASLVDSNCNSSIFYKVNMSKTRLIRANFINANLTYANLTQAQALGTNFSGAKVTGACFKQLIYNEGTNFNNIICDFVFFEEKEKERRPIEGFFAQGEFANRFREAFKVFSYITRDGFDSNILRDYLRKLLEEQKLKIEYNDQKLPINSFEIKDDGIIVFRGEIPDEEKKLITPIYLNISPIFTMKDDKNIGIEHVSGGEFTGHVDIAGILNKAKLLNPKQLKQLSDEIEKML